MMDIILKNVPINILNDISTIMGMSDFKDSDNAIEHIIMSGIIFEWLSSDIDELLIPKLLENNKDDFFQTIEEFLIRAQETLKNARNNKSIEREDA